MQNDQTTQDARRPRNCGAQGRDFRITITYTARCSESLILGGSC